MWKRHIDIVLDPTHTPQKSKITQHSRKPPPLPSRQCKRKQTKETCPVKQNKKRKQTPQRQISNYFSNPTPQPIIIHSEAPLPILPIGARRFAAQGPRRSLRLHRQKIKKPEPPQPQPTPKQVKKALKLKPLKTYKPSSTFKSHQSKLKKFMIHKQSYPHNNSVLLIFKGLKDVLKLRLPQQNWI